MIKLDEKLFEIINESTPFLFEVPLQGANQLCSLNNEHIDLLVQHINQRCQGDIKMKLSPHRVSDGCFVSIEFSGRSEYTYDILLNIRNDKHPPVFPANLESVRVHIEVPDAIDALFLLNELAKRLDIHF